MEEPRLYLSISFNEVTESEGNQIVEEVIRIRGSKAGMSVYYDEPIVREEAE